jgi:hypothetical protein
MESKFTKSRTNKGTENQGLALLLTDRRFQRVDLATKRRILELVGKTGSFSAQTFDAVMTPAFAAPITADNVEQHFAELRLVEMKTTRKSIRNESLNGFFFGATEREYEMARALGSRYLFAFVVLNSDNDYGRPFAVLLTADQVEQRTRSRRVQYQVNFRTDFEAAGGIDRQMLIVLGDASHIPH